MNKSLAIIVPLYNEEIGVENMLVEFELLRKKLSEIVPRVSVTYIDDGSTDDTFEKILSFNRNSKNALHNTKIIRLERNFGHQIAVWAGIENTRENDAVLVMDADFQDPPSAAFEMVKFTGNSDVVIGIRKSRKDNIFKKLTATIFYQIMHLFSNGHAVRNAGDFFILSSEAKKRLLRNKDRLKFLRGQILDLGLEIKEHYYKRDNRRFGKTHYSMAKMIGLAISGLVGHSMKPLIIAIQSLLSSVLLIPIFLFTSYDYVLFKHFEKFILGVILILTYLSICVFGMYIYRIVIETQQRPLYVIAQIRYLRKQDKLN
jgi:dolichol-phosphate mannosyltransferase